MSTVRYNRDKTYKEFVNFARKGDTILKKVFQSFIQSEGFVGSERSDLHSLLNSNEFLSKFSVPIKFKSKMPLLIQAQNHKVKSGISNRFTAIRGDITEAYVAWLDMNYGRQRVVDYVGNQIINISKSDKYNE